MDNQEKIIQAATELIQEKGERFNDITVREICKKAGVGLGLLNYHFGNKERLIELCVERIVNGIIDRFHSIQKETDDMPALERLTALGDMTFTFLFEHYAVSRISILADMRMPKEDDNTHRIYLAYLPLMSACRPDWTRETLERKTLSLIATMQQSFLRHEVIRRISGTDLTVPEERKAFHREVLQDLLEG